MTVGNDRTERAGEDFQNLTRYERESMHTRSPVWEEQAPTYKRYQASELLELPAPLTAGGCPLWDTVAARRTFRDFNGQPVDLAVLSQLLWACQGITGRFYDFELRSAPSAGALYPVETYVVLNRVTAQEPGLCHYRVQEHTLEVIRRGDLRESLTQAGMMQPVLHDAALGFIWTAIIGRSRWKYSQRAWRYVYLDAGHIAQNVALAAEGLGLGCCLIGAFFDTEVNTLLGVDGESETVVYMCAVGQRE
ncbi:SagB/ThcOx family dehydrogenase [bacterium]|nr:SagB/ThcOx family dehydrogenase [bacterium]